MNNNRMKLIERGEATINRQEMREGWHLCPEFDYGCTDGEVLMEDGVTCICGFDRRKVK